MRLPVVVALLLILIAGCGERPGSRSTSADGITGDRIARQAKGGEKDKKDGRGDYKDRELAAEELAMAKDAPPAGKQGGVPGKVEAPGLARKLIYEGRIALLTTEFDKAARRLEQLVEESRGYILQSEERNLTGEKRQLKMIVRIPVERSGDFRKAVLAIGFATSNSLEAEDVTDQYHDTRAEVTNLEAREAALRELYKSRQGGSKLSELFEIDREINSVRSSIDTRLGRLKRWDVVTQHATYTLTLGERDQYEPINPTVPTFGERLHDTFGGSMTALLTLGQGLVIVLVALSPWLVVLLAVAVPVWALTRRSATPTPVAEKKE